MQPDPRHDEFGADDRDFDVFTRGLSGFVPSLVAGRAIAVRVETDRRVYERGEPVEISIELRNRLPLPVEVETTRRRVWGWRVDGVLEARDEAIYRSPTRNSLSLRPRDRRSIRRVWDGRIGREEDGRTRWRPASRGEHVIEAFLTTEPERTDATTIEFR